MASLWFNISQLFCQVNLTSCVFFMCWHVIISTELWADTVRWPIDLYLNQWYGATTLVGSFDLGSGHDSQSVRQVQRVQQGELFEGKRAFIFFSFCIFPACISSFSLSYFHHRSRLLFSGGLVQTDRTSVANVWFIISNSVYIRHI